MKENMFRYFTERPTNRYYDILVELVDDYNNNQYHSTIKMTPTEASQPENSPSVIRNLYPETCRLRSQKNRVQGLLLMTLSEYQKPRRLLKKA